MNHASNYEYKKHRKQMKELYGLYGVQTVVAQLVELAKHKASADLQPLLLDECVDRDAPQVANDLQNRGYPTVTISEVGIRGFSDADIFHFACDNLLGS